MQSKGSYAKSDNQNKISIVIAAKDEEYNLAVLIDSISKLDYRKENFEVIIADDESTDSTYQTAVELTSSLENFHVYKVLDKAMPAKKGALTFGISRTSYPFILITDADCQVPVEWLKVYSSKFDEGSDFIFGPAPFQAENLFANKAARFENLRSSILMFAAARMKLPYSAAARNFGFRRSAFETIKGYSNTTETLSGDDDLLLREAVKHKMKINTIINANAIVISHAKKTLGEYLHQRARHTKTSLYYLRRHQFLLGTWHLLNLLMLLSIVLTPINFLFLLPVLIKLVCDWFMVLSQQRKFGCRFSLLEIFPLQIFYELLLIINFINANIRSEKWK